MKKMNTIYIRLAKVISKQLDNGDNDMLDGIMGMDKLAREINEEFADEKDFNPALFLAHCGLFIIDK